MNLKQVPSKSTTSHSMKIKTEAGLSLWQARHAEVLKFIDSHGVEVMVDFGSSECTLLQKVQRGMMVRMMIGVDIDQNIMSKAIENLSPETIQQDLQFERNIDQIVELKYGSVLVKYQELKSLRIDLVSLVQVIQHIEEKNLQQLNDNVFGFLRPTYVWMSTPNSDFNSLFNWQKGRKFRHDDHKFEWTRAEFNEYVDKICRKYNYRATITGVGESFLEEHRDKGFCSQIAIFERMDFPFEKNSIQLSMRQQSCTPQILPTNEPQIPLKEVYSHTNYCWLSNKDHLIQVALKEVVYKLNDIFIPWFELLELLRKKTIFRKLGQYNDCWQYDYFIKDFIYNVVKNSNLELKCEKDGIIKIQDFNEKTSYQDEMEIFSERMDQEMSELNLGMTETNEDKQEKGPILYQYDMEKFPQRGSRNKQIIVADQSKISESSQQLSSSSPASSSSSSSWQSIQIPNQPSKQKVPKRKKRNFKRRKTISKGEIQNLN